MKFQIGDDVVVKTGSVMSFKDYKFDYTGKRGVILKYSGGGYIVRFDKRSMSSFPSDYRKYVDDNFSYSDRVLFYERHLEIYVNSWKDNLRVSWGIA